MSFRLGCNGDTSLTSVGGRKKTITILMKADIFSSKARIITDLKTLVRFNYSFVSVDDCDCMTSAMFPNHSALGWRNPRVQNLKSQSSLGKTLGF